MAVSRDAAMGRIVHVLARSAPAALAVFAGANLAATAGMYVRLLLIPITLAVLATAIAWWRHRRGVCEYCVGIVPADPDAEVARNRGSLRWWHHPRHMSVIAVLTAGMLAAMLMPSRGMSSAALAVFACACAMELRCDAMHRELMPWCPWCRGGGETDEAKTPDPTVEGAL
jgi:hypothetical protein